MTLIGYTYDDALNVKLVQSTIPSSPEPFIRYPTYQINNRNSNNYYLLTISEQKQYINFIGLKSHIQDNQLNTIIDTDFNYFIDVIPVEPDKFTLPEGTIFRCVSTQTAPSTSAANYIYYIIENNAKRKIPNYKTLEVILNMFSMTLLSVKVITDNQCEDIELGDDYPDKSVQWTEAISDQTNIEALNKLTDNAKSGTQIANAASAAAASEISAVKAAESAAQAQAQAAEAASQAALAQAQAAIAEAEAKKAELDLAIAAATT